MPSPFLAMLRRQAGVPAPQAALMAALAQQPLAAPPVAPLAGQGGGSVSGGGWSPDGGGGRHPHQHPPPTVYEPPFHGGGGGGPDGGGGGGSPSPGGGGGRGGGPGGGDHKDWSIWNNPQFMAAMERDPWRAIMHSNQYKPYPPSGNLGGGPAPTDLHSIIAGPGGNYFEAGKQGLNPISVPKNPNAPGIIPRRQYVRPDAGHPFHNGRGPSQRGGGGFFGL